MQAYLEKFAFKAIFAAAVFVGAATLWLLTANYAAAAGGGGGGLNLSKTVPAVSSTVTSTAKSAATMVSSTLATTTHTASATTATTSQSDDGCRGERLADDAEARCHGPTAGRAARH